MDAYPTIEELLNTTGGMWVHSNELKEQLVLRQQALGPAYVTDELNDDGRPLNRSIKANNANDAMEEVVDAVYALLVLSLKGYRVSHIISNLNTAYMQLRHVRGQMQEEWE